MHQSYLTLWDPMDCSLPGSSVHGILQARKLEWVAIPSPGDLPSPGIEPVSLTSPALADGFFTITISATWEALCRLIFVLVFLFRNTKEFLIFLRIYFKENFKIFNILRKYLILLSILNAFKKLIFLFLDVSFYFGGYILRDKLTVQLI